MNGRMDVTKTIYSDSMGYKNGGSPEDVPGKAFKVLTRQYVKELQVD